MHLRVRFAIHRLSPGRPFLPPSVQLSSRAHAFNHPPLTPTSLRHAYQIPDRQALTEFAATTTQGHAPYLDAISDTHVTSVGGTIQPVSTSSPIHVDRFRELLSGHPNYNLVEYVTHGLTHGFSLGFSGELTRSAPRNLLSAHEHHDAVSRAIALEVGRGPFLTPPLPNFFAPQLEQLEKTMGQSV